MTNNTISFLRLSTLFALTVISAACSGSSSDTSGNSTTPTVDTAPATAGSSSGSASATPSPTASPTASATPTSTATPSATPTPVGTASPTATPIVVITVPTPTPKPVATPKPTATPCPTAQVYRSCKEILAAFPKSKDGNYTIYLGQTTTKTTVFCDMTTEGGGWTVILDGANATRAAITKYFDYATAAEVPDANFLRDSAKGIFWHANQDFVAKNMPTNSEIRLIFNLNYYDPKFKTDCVAIMGIHSPTGYHQGLFNSFTAFAQKNDSSAWVKATYNEQEFSEYQSVQTNAMASYPYPYVNGSRLFAGNPYGYGVGNTCTTFFIKRLMVR